MTPTPPMAPGETEEGKVKALVYSRAAAKHLAPSSGLPHRDRAAAALGSAASLSVASWVPVWDLGGSPCVL